MRFYLKWRCGACVLRNGARHMNGRGNAATLRRAKRQVRTSGEVGWQSGMGWLLRLAALVVNVVPKKWAESS